jgi:hypothetical protein
MANRAQELASHLRKSWLEFGIYCMNSPQLQIAIFILRLRVCHSVLKQNASFAKQCFEFSMRERVNQCMTVSFKTQGSRVAVKMLSHSRGSDDQCGTSSTTTERALAELRDEAAVMCQLYHPHIARVYGIAVLGDGKGGHQRPQVRARLSGTFSAEVGALLMLIITFYRIYVVLLSKCLIVYRVGKNTVLARLTGYVYTEYTRISRIYGLKKRILSSVYV